MDKGFPFIGWMYLKYSLMYTIFIRIAVSLMKSTTKVNEMKKYTRKKNENKQ